MKNKFLLVNVLTSLLFVLCSMSVVSNVHPKKELHNDKTLDVANAYLGDESTDLLYNKLVSDIDDTLYLKNNYSSYYFNNSSENFANNIYGSCGYVSIAMLLSFYDAYRDDTFISNEYDVNAIFSSTMDYGKDFSLVPSNTKSPGIAFEPMSLFENISKDDYLTIVDQYSDTYFQFKLFALAKEHFGNITLDSNDGLLGLDSHDISELLDYYLHEYKGFSSYNVSINYLNGDSTQSIKSSVINNIQSGTPVILVVKDDNSNKTHSVVAYDYNASSGNIYVHTGWRDEKAYTALTHVSLSDLGFTNIKGAISLNVNSPLSLGNKYISKFGNERYTASSFIFPREIELILGNYADMNPTFSWMSLWNEKWEKDKNPYFALSILDSNSIPIFEVTHINDTKYTLTTEEWDKTRINVEGERYQVLVRLDSEVYSYWDDYWCKETFSKPDTYQNIPYVNPSEYGFEDAYPIDATTKEQFKKHTVRDFEFETRRYRVGYIHNEDIVMSCIRENINEAFIEYRFETALNRLDVELSYWRDKNHEWLFKSNGTAVVQQYIKNKWVTVLDLLSDETNLSENRNNKNTYKIEFLQPAYRIRFYSSSTKVATSDDNRGRISIGMISFYESEYNLPLSGSELDYEPDKWSRYTGDTNCYSYAVNAQINPTTHIVSVMQPGQAIGDEMGDNDDILDTNSLISRIEGDANKLGFGFISIGENEICPVGYYKIAFVIDNQYSPGDYFRYDYHWYRQNSDGTWSHKPGRTPVSDLDGSKKIIMNPRLANRNSGNGLNYNLFIGYFAVKPLNLMCN